MARCSDRDRAQLERFEALQIASTEHGSIMQSFIPRFEVATLRPPQTQLIPKLGGLPWGFPVEMWPRCRQCSMPMALLAQLPHHGPALDFGDSRWVLHMFQCTTAGCSTWTYDEGCNAAFMLPREIVGVGLTQAPQPTSKRPGYAWITASAPVVRSMHGELRLIGWQQHEDAIQHYMSPAYFDPYSFGQLPMDFSSRTVSTGGFVQRQAACPTGRRMGPLGFLLARSTI